jgi:hypothetical protein
VFRLSQNANKLDQAGIGITERQQDGSRLTDSVMVPVFVPAPLVFTGCCAQVCRFLKSAYSTIIRSSLNGLKDYRWDCKVIGEKISGTLEKESTRLIQRGIYETGGISLHMFLCKNIVEETKCKEDELCEPIE